MSQAFPLQWPVGWPRTQIPSSSKFGSHSITEAIRELQRQLELAKASGVTLSSNVTLGQTPKDKGVCVYFILRGKPYALPCDKWNTVEDNLWALAKHVESIRGQERWGVGTIERHFAGYAALPQPGKSWWRTLGVLENASVLEIQNAYRELAKKCHPDAGGSEAAMMELNAAYAAAKEARS